MNDDPRATDREQYVRWGAWTKRQREDFNEAVRSGLSPADDIAGIPPERGPFLSFAGWLETQDDEMRQRVARISPTLKDRYGISFDEAVDDGPA